MTPATAQPQIPDEFTNLEVLPPDISKDELVSVMRGFASALGVRCQFCHVGEDPTLTGFDFAADAKETKSTARVMMQMTREINQKILPRTGRADLLEVTCMTCHRRTHKPETLHQVLTRVVAEDGVEAALRRYRELRDEYRDRGIYDFSGRTLSKLANDAKGRGALDDALAIQRFNLEIHPDTAIIHFLIADIQVARGEQAEAARSLLAGLELEPDNARARSRLEELEREMSEAQ